MTPDWRIKFLGLAEHVGSWSKDPSTQVGAVFVEPETKNILSVGYNGFPKGIKDHADRLYSRSVKNSMMVHAEKNAIYNATANGVQLRGSWIFVTGLPVCDQCALGLIQVGVKNVVMQKVEIPDRWVKSWDMSRSYFDEAGVSYDFV